MKRNNTITLMSPMSRHLQALTLVLFTLLLSACFPNPDPDDESHATFAREAIPVLLGRRPYGVDEVESVADIAELLGRDVAVNMLMKDTAFVDHWADALIDILQVQRFRQGGLLASQDKTCWGEPTRANPDLAIAEWVRDHGPRDAGAPTPAWNMTDLLRSAIAIDDLSPLYRANLLTTSIRRGGSGGRNKEQAQYLMQVYLNRNTDCLGCHNAEQSTSNKTDGSGNIVWRRLWSIPGHAEQALFGGYANSGGNVFDNLSRIMRSDVRRPEGPGFGIRPWGITQSCATDSNDTSPQNAGDVTAEGFQLIPADATNYSTAKFGSLDGSTNGKLSVWELEQALHDGVISLQDGYERYPATTANHPAGSDEEKYCNFVKTVQDKCDHCHQSGGQSPDMGGTDPAQEIFDANLVTPGNLAASTLWNRVDGGGMPPASQPQLTATEKTRIQTWIADGAPNPGDTSICSPSELPLVDADEAFAFLTASNLVDGIWESVMGSPLTIDHGFPRNKDQMHMLWNLTESVFVKHDWSLKSVLSKIMTSNWYGRRAPNLSQEGTAYELPPVLDPWIVADPTVVNNPKAHEKHNGQGELVKTYRVNTVLRNIASSLGWKEPQRFRPDITDTNPGNQNDLNVIDYPYPLNLELGQFLSPTLSGFKGVNFQSLLALESRIGSGGTCEKEGRTENDDDWIDLLTTAITSHNNANPHAPITLGSAWSIVKDRLIQDTTIETTLPSGLKNIPGAKTEQQAVVDFFRVDVDNSLTINSSTASLTINQLKLKLRQACNTIIKSPGFFMPNISLRGYSDNQIPDSPELNVCLPGESCGYAKSCSKWGSVLRKMGHQTICEDHTIRPGVLYFFEGVLSTGLTLSKDHIFKLKNIKATKKQFEPRPPVLKDSILMLDRDSINTNTAPRASINSGLLNRTTGAATVAGTATTTATTTAPIVLNRDTAVIRTPATTLETSRISDVLITERRPTLAQAETNLNIIEGLKVLDITSGKHIKQKGIDRVRQRLTSLCLDGLCGFTPRSNLQQCLVNTPKAGSCNRLLATCNPRCTDGDNCCGNKPADASASGVMSIWAEGAIVKQTRFVRILPFGSRSWKQLRPNTKLQAGDLLDVPLKATLAIQSGNVIFGDKGIDSETKGIRHMIAITGPSTDKVLAKAVKKNTLSPNTLAAGVKSEKYMSRGVSKQQWSTILKRQIKPVDKYKPSPKEILEELLDYETQHEGMEALDKEG